MSNAGDVPDQAIAALADFLSAQISGLTVRQEWPYANEKLQYPSLTISTNNPKRLPIDPYQISQSVPDIDGNTTVKTAIAFWEDTFQLDLWCSNKLERKTYTQAIIDAFNSQANLNTVNLVLTGNFADLCAFEIENVKCIDNERAAETQERREMITVLVNCREIRQTIVPAMIHIESTVDVNNDF